MRVKYIARHGEGFGKNHFGDMSFDTIEEAQAHIDEHKSGLPDNKGMSEENREYWKGIGEHMYIEKATYTYEEARTIFTFGSSLLPELGGKINPMKIMLVVDMPEREARDWMREETFIGMKFAFSYGYSKASEFKEKYNMHEVTYDELVALKDEK